MAVAFGVPQVAENQDGWGPDASSVPSQLEHVPYAPFSKGDRVGRASDWTGQAFKYNQGRFDRNNPAGASVFNFFHNEDEDSFHLVDTRPPPRPKYGGRRFQQRFQRRDRDEGRRDGGRDSGAGADRERQRRERLQQQKRGQWNAYWQDKNAPRIIYNSSVDIRPEWAVLEQIPLTSLSKLSYEVGEPEDVTTCGTLEYYNKTYDRVTPKTEKPLERFENRQFYKVTTTDDPVIRRLLLEDENVGTVFATDAILATLMCSPRSVYSWDIVIQKVGNKLFLDKRDASFDLLTVYETAQEPIPEEKDSINSVHSLSQEATFINQNFSQQVLQKDGKKFQFKEPNPFASENEEVASVAYRYRKWKLDADITLVARCELHGVSEVKGSEVLLTINALNEFDSRITGVDWRQKIENQRGAVLATELKNNANKLAKWTAQALLSGADQMKLGYVSRVHPKDNFNHTVLTIQGYKPKEFAGQINLNVNNMWGILKTIVDICTKLDEGKYLLVKDPNKPTVRLYSVPADAFENDYAEEPLPEDEQAPPPPEIEEKPELAEEKDTEDI
jgi:translation initiation factor 3 subunit D